MNVSPGIHHVIFNNLIYRLFLIKNNKGYHVNMLMYILIFIYVHTTNEVINVW